ncbi:low-density lipoprotein receptor-related protein-like [Saccostrea cucullata]|uniref:low-density lipoprotein receptor-related protein-like n=1 Tax=Saccostrea cuccullata TaxID=36930 RepID=UPI002ED081B1
MIFYLSVQLFLLFCVSAQISNRNRWYFPPLGIWDFPNGQRCEFGICQPDHNQDFCTLDVQCPENYWCDKGRCVPGRRRCGRTMPNCQVGYYCSTIAGVCLPNPEQESTNCEITGCPEGYYCSHFAGICLPSRNTCFSDTDCPENNWCNRGRCEQGLRPCGRGRPNCPSGYYCNHFAGVCERNPEQESTNCEITGCPEGYYCSHFAGICLPNPVEDQRFCETTFDCPRGYSCVSGICRNRRNTCFSDTDCPENNWCNRGRCQPGLRPCGRVSIY